MPLVMIPLVFSTFCPMRDVSATPRKYWMPSILEQGAGPRRRRRRHLRPDSPWAACASPRKPREARWARLRLIPAGRLTAARPARRSEHRLAMSRLAIASATRCSGGRWQFVASTRSYTVLARAHPCEPARQPLGADPRAGLSRRPAELASLDRALLTWPTSPLLTVRAMHPTDDAGRALGFRLDAACRGRITDDTAGDGTGQSAVPFDAYDWRFGIADPFATFSQAATAYAICCPIRFLTILTTRILYR